VPLELVDGWVLLQTSNFRDQLVILENEVRALARKHPDTYLSKNATKRLAAIHKLIFQVIPLNPGGAEYLQGNTLGADNRHWRRAKFLQQYRLFFRYDTKSKIIIYGWVNDASTKRAYGSGNDAYSVFQRMLESGNPPSDWASLIENAQGFETLSQP